MVVSCVAYGCTNEHNKNKAIQFHRFPFNRPNMLNLWVIAIKRDKWLPTKHSRLCSGHFKDTDYMLRPGSSVKLLKLDAIPSIFNFPKHMQRAQTSRRVLIHKMDENQIPEVCENNERSMDVDKPVKKMQDAACQTRINLQFQEYVQHRKIKTLRQNIRRKNRKINSMKNLIQELKNRGCSTDNLMSVMNSYFQGFPLEFLIQQHNNKNAAPAGRRYTEKMKEFAHTLYFYSPKAYNFVRQHFVLPNGRTIRKWLTSVECYPGFLSEVLAFLKEEVISKKYLKHCALIIDGMSIKKQIVWNDAKGKFEGYTNYGGIIDVDHDSPASEALFFQIVSYTYKFKCPIAYFLVNKADANIQRQLIITCLRNLFEIGITIHSITCDGTETNKQTFVKLGCNFNNFIADPTSTLISSFGHPCCSSINIHCMLDTCHMLKLARNCMAERNLISSTGTISWTFIKNLHELQDIEQLRLANSLTFSHIHYKNKIMNVRLAAQVVSSAVANALKYLQQENYSKFQGCDATVEFILIIDRIFDILNARNPFGKGFKAPMRKITITYFEDVFKVTIAYLSNLKIDGISILQHPRKTFALGLILTMKSTLELAKDLFSLTDDPLLYFLPYKCSQDHLELYFSCLRSRGGWNNNPNTQQLRWSLRQLLFRNSVKSSVSANCSDFGNDCTPTFEFRSENRTIVTASEQEDFNYQMLNFLNDKTLSDYQENVLYYICGFVVRNLVKRVSCSACVEILLHRHQLLEDDSYSNSSSSFKKFTSFTTNGGLILTSTVVYKIIHFVERSYQKMITCGTKRQNANFKYILKSAAIHKFSDNLNLFQPPHPICEEFMSGDLHELQLIKGIVDLYLKCRMHHQAKMLTESAQRSKLGLRQKLTKLILFNNQ